MHSSDKIFSISALSKILEAKRSGKTVAHCHGVFDLLHIGHMRHFEQASKSADILVVTVTPDHFVNKGPGRPVFSDELRCEAIASLKCVDYVAVNEWPTAVETIAAIRPDLYIKGSEYKKSQADSPDYINVEELAVKQSGGKMHFTEDEVIFSSSKLINKHLPVFSEEVTQYLQSFKKLHSPEKLTSIIESFKDLKVLVVGEAIIDDYHYVQTMGKASKEPILASKLLSRESYCGGSLAIANHISAFVDQVELVTFLGDHETQEDLVRDSLNENITPNFFYKDKSPTITKRRFIEKELVQKLFEIYIINDEPLNSKQDKQFCQWLEKKLPEYDVVIVSDYGHGMMSPAAIKILCEQSKFLAANAQSNAGNQGNNSISRYHGADLITMAGHEMARECRNSHLTPSEMLLTVSENVNAPNVVLTRGKYGTLCSSGKKLSHTPAIAPKIVDRVGAGDAVLSLVSLAYAKETPLDIIGFIGNAAGAEAVATVGNKSTIEQIPFIKHLQSLLK